jgi:hypothetical protein
VGRPKILADIGKLIPDMSGANPLWGAPRIHGELLKLEIDVGQRALPCILWHDSLPCLAALSGQPPRPEGRAFASCLSLPD